MSSGSKDLSIPPNRLYSKQWSGGNSPDLANKRENSYNMTGVDAIKGGHFIKKDKNGRYEYAYPSWVAGNEPNIRWSALELQALNRAISHVRGHDFSLPVALGEGRETVGMLADTLRKIWQGFKAAKKGNLAEAARQLGGNGRGLPSRSRKPLDGQDLASFYLGMRYGWVPMLGEVYNATEAYRHRVTHGDWSIVGRGRASTWQNYEGSTVPIYITLPCIQRASVRVKLVLTRKLNLPEHLGLNNPFSVAWELLPLSFVFDWAMPVGDYLSVINAVPAEGTQVVISRRTERRNLSNPVSKNLKPVAPMYTEYLNGNSWMRYRQLILTRSVSTWASYKVPAPQFNKPGDLFNWKRVLDVAALGKSLLLK